MVLRGGPRGRVGRRRTCLKRAAPDVVERPSSLVWVVFEAGGLVSVAEEPETPKGQGASSGNPKTSRGAKTPEARGSNGYGQGRPAYGGSGQNRRTGAT